MSFSIVVRLSLLARANLEEGQSFAEWCLSAIGVFYAALIGLTGLAIFVLACVVVAASRRPGPIAASLVLVPLPFFIGLFRTLTGLVASFSVIAVSGVELKNSELAAGLAESTVPMLEGLLVAAP